MIDCHKCDHYYVTWDKDYPHGCRGLGLKSHEFPSQVVYKSSGIPCFMFKPRGQREGFKGPKDPTPGER